MIDGIRREELEKATSGQSSHVCCPLKIEMSPQTDLSGSIPSFFLSTRMV